MDHLVERLRAQAERHEALAASVGRRKDDLAADTLEWKAADEIDRLQGALAAAEEQQLCTVQDAYDAIKKEVDRADSSSTALAEAVQRAYAEGREGAFLEAEDCYARKRWHWMPGAYDPAFRWCKANAKGKWRDEIDAAAFAFDLRSDWEAFKLAFPSDYRQPRSASPRPAAL